MPNGIIIFFYAVSPPHTQELTPSLLSPSPHVVVASAEGGGLVTEATAAAWAESVCSPRMSASQAPWLLLADSCPAHLGGAELRARVEGGATRGRLALLPEACSHRLQPLHRGLKARFKVSFSYFIFKPTIRRLALGIFFFFFIMSRSSNKCRGSRISISGKYLLNCTSVLSRPHWFRRHSLSLSLLSHFALSFPSLPLTQFGSPGIGVR